MTGQKQPCQNGKDVYHYIVLLQIENQYLKYFLFAPSSNDSYLIVLTYLKVCISIKLKAP